MVRHTLRIYSKGCKFFTVRLTILETYVLKCKQISTFVWKILKVILVILALSLALIFLKAFMVRRLEFFLKATL